ncbi:glycosyltransferase family 9 protein [Noviherbaspirillum galbum]|uniref:Glycosyltransferase family 9 protein n=1 Tax=Noviherbaspirillum galbum TaxID=2709383 RepID=A0A6B3SJK4_9BURK|nr:glycosyltransferase family 9 protein [Noviherbaspirillum galbum]NEX60913.1 glycosyltransferase family 9 protein [Noviherbaspirillum galbum]
MKTRLTPSHILICRTDNIGDVVLTLPLAGFLRQRFPAARIGFLVRGYAAPMVRCCKALDYVVELEQLGDAAEEFSRSDVDTIIFAKPDKRLARAAKKAGIRNRVGTSHRWFHWLTCNRLAHFSRVKSDLHEAQLNFKLLKPLGIDYVPALQDIPALYHLQAPDHPGLPALPREQLNIVIHPRSNGNGREWPLRSFTDLARLLQTQGKIRLWVTGSAGEGEWIARHAPDLIGMPNVNNMCGRFGLDELTAFIAACDGLVASGTGPLHLSAALGQRTLGLFPPMRPIDPGRWGALGARAQVLVKPTGCDGCSDPADCACMRNITPKDVADVIDGWEKQVFHNGTP